MEATIALVCLALAALPLVMTIGNCVYLAAPAPSAAKPRVAVLIPARNEAGNIEKCIAAVLASEEADVTVLVGDDGSTDETAAIVERVARSDDRVRLRPIPALPPGWNGKQHACAELADAEGGCPLILFLDADVRLEPRGAAYLAARLDAGGVAMVSGVPRQILGSLWERLLIPVINTLLLGYLPMPLMRTSASPGLGAACGQMIMVRRTAYEEAGGHAAIRDSIHDGLKLPRAFRRAGFKTDLVDGSKAASCRMYDNGPELREGFMKNATEGMARPFALPVWTVLLLGGHVLPWLLLARAAATGDRAIVAVAGGACAASVLSRVIQALYCREPLITVPLHPVGVCLAILLQWRALLRHYRRRPAMWRGRSYATHG